MSEREGGLSDEGKLSIGDEVDARPSIRNWSLSSSSECPMEECCSGEDWFQDRTAVRRGPGGVGSRSGYSARRRERTDADPSERDGPNASSSFFLTGLRFLRCGSTHWSMTGLRSLSRESARCLLAGLALRLRESALRVRRGLRLLSRDRCSRSRLRLLSCELGRRFLSRPWLWLLPRRGDSARG